MYTHTYLYIHIFICSYFHIFIYSYIHIFIYSYIYIFIYSYIYLFRMLLDLNSLHYNLLDEYRVAKTHRTTYLRRLFSAKEPYN